MNAPATTTTPAIGSEIGGGFFAGVILMHGNRYGIIDSGKAGEITGTWGKYGEKLDGCRSFVDGLANTRAMAAAGSKPAQQVLDLRLGGNDDWHIPARDVLEVIYRNLKPTDQENYASYMDGYNANSEKPGELYTAEDPAKTEVDPYREGGEHAYAEEWYWSSTQSSATCAFDQDFSDGGQNGGDKDGSFRVRAVRLILL